MDSDIDRLIGAVNREIASREVDGHSARVLVATRTYDTTLDDLWDALTNADRIQRWFLPISGDLRQGGHYQFEGNAGGEITFCEPPHHLAVTWGMHEQVSWVRVDLSEVETGVTTLRLEHAWVPDETWDQYGPGAAGIGWEQGLLGLETHLADNPSLSPESAVEWLASDDGKVFVRASSDAWCAAAISAGADHQTAQARAERCRAAYVGETEVAE